MKSTKRMDMWTDTNKHMGIGRGRHLQLGGSRWMDRGGRHADKWMDTHVIPPGLNRARNSQTQAGKKVAWLCKRLRARARCRGRDATPHPSHQTIPNEQIPKHAKHNLQPLTGDSV